MKYLNTNKEIIAMWAGGLDPLSPNEVLFIGSKTNLLAYGKPHDLTLYNRRGEQQRHLRQGGN
jgi:hypothetical protein